jgi:hypothetical protein
MTNEEQKMSQEKQIEEIANDINKHCCSLAEQFCGETSCNACLTMFLYNAGYRKQEEGEWEYEQLDNFRKYKVTCPFCKSYYIGNYDAYDDPEYFNFCPECGAKMKGD